MDIQVQNEGSIYLLRSLTAAGEEWIEEHIPEDAQTWGNAIVVEHRFIDTIVLGAMTDGLIVGE